MFIMSFKKWFKFAAIFFCSALISGCLHFPSANQIGLVINYRDNQSLIEDKVKEQSRQFKHIFADVKRNFLRPGFSKKQMLNKYGDPVVSFSGADESDIRETWLYREPLKYSNVDRVYLYFGKDDKLLSWEYKPAEGSGQ